MHIEVSAYFSCFPEIDRQWVVEAHRAGPLTLAAFRLPGAEALSGEFF
jgi:hypothetical protein